MNHHQEDVMIDIETLGTSPGCVILSIAAVPFGAYSEGCDIEPLYEAIAMTSCTAIGLTVDEATWKWWHNQNAAVREEAFSGTTPLSTALLSLREYLGQFPKDTRIWGKGASFDVPILEAAYKKFDQAAPWRYYQSMCYRTLEALAPAGMLAPMDKKVKHNALEDAKYQAACAKRILTWLSSR